MRIINFFSSLAIAAAAMLVSCSAPKNITYMQGYSEGATQAVAEQRRITVQADDKLSIVVSSKDPALAEAVSYTHLTLPSIVSAVSTDPTIPRLPPLP